MSQQPIKTSSRLYVESVAKRFKQTSDFSDMMQDASPSHAAHWLDKQELEFDVSVSSLLEAL